MVCQTSQRNEEVHLERDNSSETCHSFPWRRSRQPRLANGPLCRRMRVSGYFSKTTAAEAQCSFCGRHGGLSAGLQAPFIRSHTGGSYRGHCPQPEGPGRRTLSDLIKRQGKQDRLPLAPSNLFTVFLFLLLVLSGGLFKCTSLETVGRCPFPCRSPSSLCKQLQAVQTTADLGESNALGIISSISFPRLHQKMLDRFCGSSITLKTICFPPNLCTSLLTQSISHVCAHMRIILMFLDLEGVRWHGWL